MNHGKKGRLISWFADLVVVARLAYFFLSAFSFGVAGGTAGQELWGEEAMSGIPTITSSVDG